MATKSLFKPGQIVIDEHGVQCTILTEWGGLYCCPDCGELATPKIRTKCHKKKPLGVGAEGIYDVVYKGGRRAAWNQCWLKPVEALTAV